MNNLLAIACGTGLQDGLNPCIFMACAVFICYSLFVIPAKAGIHNFSRMCWWPVIFGLAYAAGILAFNFGPAQIFVFQKNFIFAAKIIYFVLGLWAFVLGVLFFKDWFLMRKRLPADEFPSPCGRGQGRGILGALLMTIILAVALSALATLWPINYYIMLLGNEAILKGQWQMGMPLLGGYVFFTMWPLWFIWAFLSIKNLRPSLVKIICASVFFTASSCVIFILK